MISKLLSHVVSLREDEDTNIVEEFFSLNIMCNGAKRVNHPLGPGWGDRFMVAILHKNENDAITHYIEKRFDSGCPPHYVALMRDVERKREYNQMVRANRIEARTEAALLLPSSAPVAPPPSSSQPLSTSPTPTPISMPLLSSSAALATPATPAAPAAPAAPAEHNHSSSLTAQYYGSGNGPRVDLETESWNALLDSRDLVLRQVLAHQTLRDAVDVVTEFQHGNPLWNSIRRLIVTASHFGEICVHMKNKSLRTKSWQTKLYKKLYTSLQFSHTDYGHAMEAVGRERAAVHAGVDRVEPSGLCLSADNPMLGASPDGWILPDLPLEIKSLSSCRHLPVSQAAAKADFLKKNPTGWEMKRSHKYFAQIQGQMFVTGTRRCMVLVQTDVDSMMFEERADDVFMADRLESLADFFWFQLLELSDSRVARDMPIRTYDECMRLVESDDWRAWPAHDPTYEAALVSFFHSFIHIFH